MQPSGTWLWCLSINPPLAKCSTSRFIFKTGNVGFESGRATLKLGVFGLNFWEVAGTRQTLEIQVFVVPLESWRAPRQTGQGDARRAEIVADEDAQPKRETQIDEQQPAESSALRLYAPRANLRRRCTLPEPGTLSRKTAPFGIMKGESLGQTRTSIVHGPSRNRTLLLILICFFLFFSLVIILKFQHFLMLKNALRI